MVDRRSTTRPDGKENPVGDGAWFAARRIGYGAGLPIAWQGWLMLVIHISAMAVMAAQFHNRGPVGALVVGITALAPLPLYAARTRGGWKWRWRHRD